MGSRPSDADPAPPDPAPPPSLADRLGGLGPPLVVLLAAVFALRRLDHTDTWWHLAGGRWIAQHGRVPYLDPLSWTVPDRPWINTQWLFDLLLYLLHGLGGPSLLVVTSMLAYAGATAVMVATMRRRSSAVVTTVLGAWVVAASQDRFAIRPEMATFLCLQAVLWLYATGRTPGRRRLWLLVPLMVLWVNLHGLFSVGLVVIGCQVAAVIAMRLGLVPAGWRATVDPIVFRRLVASGAAAAAVTVVGPFGVEGATFPLVLLARVRGDDPVFGAIDEFKPPFEAYVVTCSLTLYQVLFVVSLVVVAAAAVLALRQGRRPQRAPFAVGDLLVFLGFAYLSLMARRNVALFAMGTAPFLAACVQALADAAAPGAAGVGVALRRAVRVAAVPLLLTATWFVASNGYYRWNGELHEFGLGVLEAQFPIRGATFAREQGLAPPLFNDFTNGGYLAWAEPVPGGVYIDGRTEVYETAFFSTYVRLLRDPAAWQAEADRRGIQTVFFFHWWPDHQPLARWLLRDPRWALVFFDHTSIVLVRREGNAGLIARAQAAFEPVRHEMEAALAAPVSSWQWPVGRVRSVMRYAVVLDMMGRSVEAMPFYELVLTLGPDDRDAVSALLRLAQHQAATGSKALARRYLARAAERDPASPHVARLRAQLGSSAARPKRPRRKRTSPLVERQERK